jgi:hypothetical protein
MWKRILVFSLVLLVNGMVSVLLGQEKSLSYYDQHPEEILRDAQGYFRKGNYERTIDLCKYHYIIVGDSSADALQKKAELCERLTKEINEKTEELQSANPEDPLVLKLNPVESVLDSIHVIVNNDGGTSSGGDGDSNSTPDNKSDSVTETEKDINGIQWVDLGLPSGLKWATKNIGAKQNSDFGFFFSWDEDTLKDSDDAYVIKTRAVGAYSTQQTSAQKDAATHFLGAPWRTPNNKDWEELKVFCSWTWMMVNGRAGYLVESFKNGNSIFLPACGCYGTQDNRIGRQQGYYWSSTPQIGEPRKGNCFLFNEKRIETKTYLFSFGLSIRAVSD